MSGEKHLRCPVKRSAERPYCDKEECAWWDSALECCCVLSEQLMRTALWSSNSKEIRIEPSRKSVLTKCESCGRIIPAGITTCDYCRQFEG